MKKVVFFDLETSGLNSWKHEIIQIAAVAVSSDDFSEIERFGPFHVEFDISKASPEALKINHYDENDWKDAISQKELVACFRRFLENHKTVKMTSKAGNTYFVAQLAGHNINKFDIPFLRETFKRQDAFLPAAMIGLDTLQLAAWHFFTKSDKPPNLKLETLAKHFGIEFEGAHDAMADVLVNIEVATALLEQS